MAEIDNRCVAFKNDHTYLKTGDGERDNLQLINPKLSTAIESKNDAVPSTIKQENMVTNMKTLPKVVNPLNVASSNIFILPDNFNFQSSPNINILQNNMTFQNHVGKKSSVRPIQPKITNNMKIVPSTQIHSNVLFIPSANTTLNTKLQNNMIQKKSPVKPKLHIGTQDKPAIKPIKPMKNKVVKDFENGVCTIKLSSNLLKRIQSGEKLFMCMECDKIYTEHKDLLDHQMTHDKCDKKTIVKEKKPSEKVFSYNVKREVIESEKQTNNDNNVTKQINNDNNVTKQTKLILKPPVKPKKRKVIFQGECIMCHSVFPDLDKHIRTVHQDDLNKNKNLNHHCYKCNMQFDIKQQLRAHEMSAHKPIGTYTCEHCFEDFLNKEQLETHIETHYNESMKYLCPYCDAGFPHSNGLRTHLIKHIGFNSPENNSTFEMPSSQIDYSPTRTPEHLDQLFAELDHIKEEVDDIYIEQVSDDNYEVKFVKDNEDNVSSTLDSFLDDHKIDIELKNDPLEENKIVINQQQMSLSHKKRVSYTVCRICMIIVSYSRIGRHMKKKHNNAAPYQCEICHAEFNRKHIMDDHRRKHTNNKPHKCNECSKCFTYKHHLSRHMMIVHNADSLEKPFKCSVCDKAFSFKEYLTLHVNSRHKGKHYMCQICGKNFSTNAALNKHQLCHTDERPFMCEHCGRTFKCKTHCDTHKKNMHPGDPQQALSPEKYECNLCHKMFSTKIYRDMHFKRHNGQGHQCDTCYKLFVSKAHMQRHIKIMHQS